MGLIPGVRNNGVILAGLESLPASTQMLVVTSSGVIQAQAIPGGGSLTVREVDGTPSGVATEIVFPDGTVSLASGVATIAVVTTDDARLTNARTPTAHNHDAAAITTGTLDDARLSANVAMRNAANTFAQPQTVNGIITSNSTSGGLHIVNSAMRLVRNGNALLLENQSNGHPLDLSQSNTGTVNVVGAQGGLPSLGFSSTRSNTTPATRISEASAGVLQIGTTANNALGSLNLANLTASGTGRVGTLTVATLPAAASNLAAEINVSDSSVTTFGSIVAGGGASNVKVRSNGTNWTVQGA